MLTYQDCVALCGLNHWEVEAIAEHEHIPPIVAAELGNYLCRNAAGERCIQSYILEDIAAAERRGDQHHAKVLQAVLRHFVSTHPLHAGGAGNTGGVKRASA
ncbi:MAG TPA: hypothetical protein VHA35_08000 [Dongiaceae bacterium]|nr:hypothetical protein [Dongiaceae bacterium]